MSKAGLGGILLAALAALLVVGWAMFPEHGMSPPSDQYTGAEQAYLQALEAQPGLLKPDYAPERALDDGHSICRAEALGVSKEAVAAMVATQVTDANPIKVAAFVNAAQILC